MTFELTDEEQTRIELAQLGGVTVDPIGYGDLAVVVILGVLYSLNMLAAIFLLWNRNYPPLKSKYPYLMAAMILGLMVWFIGDLVLKSHVHLSGKVLTNCLLFCAWLRIVFGAYMVSALVTIRSYALYCIFVSNRPYRGKYVYVSTGVAVGVGLIFVIITYALPATKTVHFVPVIDMCSMGYAYRAVVQVLLWLTWTVNAAFCYQLRNITSSFNETVEMGLASILVFALLLFNTVILYTHPLYPTQLSLRMAETLCSHMLANFLWWFIMFRSMYCCAFRREKYLGEWKTKLVNDGLQKQYQISRTDPFSVTMVSVETDNVAKLVSLPRGMVTDHDGFDAHTSFSRHSASTRSSGGEELAKHPDDYPGLWRPPSARHTAAAAMESDEQLASRHTFSPAYAARPITNMENSSSTSTIHNEKPDALSQYNFPLPPKSKEAQ